MRVLLVTSQLVDIVEENYYCISNFYDIVRRFCYLGEVAICCNKYDGHNSHLLLEKNLSEIVTSSNIHIIGRSPLFVYSKHQRNILLNCIRDVDLVIDYGSSFHLFAMAKSCGKKFMSFVVSCNWDAYWNHGMLGKVLAPIKYFEARYVIKHSNYVLYVSNMFLQRRYPTDAIIKEGCSNVRIDPMNQDTLSHHISYVNNTFTEQINIATTAAIDVRYKGQEYVLKALYKLKQSGVNNIHYYLIGGGNQSFLCSLARKYKIENNVHFLGSIAHDKIFEVLDGMHIYIQPSLQEGLPRAMVEAMSRGLMCIGANTAAIPELIQNKYVVRRKSSKDIKAILEKVSVGEIVCQGQVNFEEAKKYQEVKISERRCLFFDKVRSDMDCCKN